ncbi:NUDIX domain-containing protein [Streptomyces jumonjinensis]|uniref:NUDIX domain-containing protein n=1 Tax=Streptomyces jumonjinensis TaxID=1945 RepID=UPI003799360E
MNTDHARPQVSAGAIIRDEQGRVLIVKPTYRERWNLPGGRINTGEIPSQACRREIHEELGLDLNVGRLLATAYFVLPDGTAHVYFGFDGGLVSAIEQRSIRIQEAEIEQFRFAAPEEISPDDIPPIVRPLWEAALKALTSGDQLFLEVDTRK